MKTREVEYTNLPDESFNYSIATINRLHITHQLKTHSPKLSFDDYDNSDKPPTPPPKPKRPPYTLKKVLVSPSDSESSNHDSSTA